MPIFIKPSIFTPHPAGTFAAVCVDAIDVGSQRAYDGKLKPLCDLVFQTGELMENGAPYNVRRRYTQSTHKDSSLRHDLESWRGRPFSKEELDNFDLEVVVGASCLLVIVQRETNGNLYANIEAILPLPKGTATPSAYGYIRQKDREGLASASRGVAPQPKPNGAMEYRGSAKAAFADALAETSRAYARHQAAQSKVADPEPIASGDPDPITDDDVPF